MKKLFIVLFISILFASCADNKVINGVEYRPYRLINQESTRVDSVEYQISPYAAVSGIVFMECFFIPTVYTYGYNLYEPVCLKKDYHEGINGIVK